MSADTFRDTLSTVDSFGKRKWIYVKKPSGRYYNLRSYLSYVYFFLFFTLPFLTINKLPALQLNLAEGKIYLLGSVITPQEFVILGLAMITGVLFIVVFTLAYGRIFCGWICPQTVFMEMLFRKIEWAIEGSPANQIQQDQEGLDSPRIHRKILKHFIFLVLSFLIANTFLAYLIGWPKVWSIMTDDPAYHIKGLIGISVFSFIFYGVFAYTRELVCTVICPYGRLQSVLTDKTSMLVAYDYRRGEPRGKKHRDIKSSRGDCVDCTLCVQVCPTGIDIRNGSQMECIQCTACVDACNQVMHKIKRPQGLIRYASESQIETGKGSIFTYRYKLYTGALVFLSVVFFSLILTRSIVDGTLMRIPGQILQEREDGTITNLYRLALTNKGMHELPVKLSVNDPDVTLIVVGKELNSLHPNAKAEQIFFLKAKKDEKLPRKMHYQIKVKSGHETLQTYTATFVTRF